MVEYWPSERISGGVFSEILPGYSLWRNDCSPHRLARNLKNFYYLSSQGETANTLSTARTILNTIISVAAVSTMALPLFASASVSNNAGGAVNVVYNKGVLQQVGVSENQCRFSGNGGQAGVIGQTLDG